MTREEAIDLLDNLIGAIEDNHGSDYDGALKLAIKALEQEPKLLNTLDFAVDASNGDTNYFVGFRNGLRYAKSLIDGEEPQFESCVEQEPKTGHWIVEEWNNKEHHTCSVCQIVVDYEPCYHYCPYCGAKMAENKE